MISVRWLFLATCIALECHTELENGTLGRTTFSSQGLLVTAYRTPQAPFVYPIKFGFSAIHENDKGYQFVVDVVLEGVHQRYNCPESRNSSDKSVAVMFTLRNHSRNVCERADVIINHAEPVLVILDLRSFFGEFHFDKVFTLAQERLSILPDVVFTGSMRMITVLMINVSPMDCSIDSPARGVRISTSLNSTVTLTNSAFNASDGISTNLTKCRDHRTTQVFIVTVIATEDFVLSAEVIDAVLQPSCLKITMSDDLPSAPMNVLVIAIVPVLVGVIFICVVVVMVMVVVVVVLWKHRKTVASPIQAKMGDDDEIVIKQMTVEGSSTSEVPKLNTDECGVMQTSVAIDHSEMQLSEEEATSNISASSRFERDRNKPLSATSRKSPSFSIADDAAASSVASSESTDSVKMTINPAYETIDCTDRLHDMDLLSRPQMRHFLSRRPPLDLPKSEDMHITTSSVQETARQPHFSQRALERGVTPDLEVRALNYSSQ